MILDKDKHIVRIWEISKKRSRRSTLKYVKACLMTYSFNPARSSGTSCKSQQVISDSNIEQIGLKMKEKQKIN